MTNEEKKQNLVKVLGNALSERLAEKSPVSAAFTPFLFSFR